MDPFTVNQWIVVLLVFVLGLVIGMYLFAGAKWKRRYREEARLRGELEAENKRLRSEAAESHTLRGAAARHPVDRDRGPL
jgi:uncharacterized membrane-anchored protein YhcB (DUF1043 family)